MPPIHATCERCGDAVMLDLPAALADFALVGVICQECANHDVEERGGVVLDLAQVPAGALFAPGRVTITPGAVAALGNAGEHAIAYLPRHLRGDWGANGQVDAVSVTDAPVRAGPLVTDDDAKQNKLALLTCTASILSDYATCSNTSFGRSQACGSSTWPVVFDEAHKLAAHFFGSKIETTGRFRFAEKLGRDTRHLLLMTATPHNGKEEDFQLFLPLLDSDRFYGKFRDGVHKVDVSKQTASSCPLCTTKKTRTTMVPCRLYSNCRCSIEPRMARRIGTRSRTWKFGNSSLTWFWGWERGDLPGIWGGCWPWQADLDEDALADP